MLLEAVDPQMELGLDFVKEIAKQLISLATGVLTLSVTFTKDIAKQVPADGTKWLKTAWVLLLISIFCGIAELSALAGALLPIKQAPLSIPSNSRIFGFLQLLLFCGGTTAIMVYGFKVLTIAGAVKPSDAPQSISPGRG